MIHSVMMTPPPSSLAVAIALAFQITAVEGTWRGRFIVPLFRERAFKWWIDKRLGMQTNDPSSSSPSSWRFT